MSLLLVQPEMVRHKNKTSNLCAIHPIRFSGPCKTAAIGSFTSFRQPAQPAQPASTYPLCLACNSDWRITIYLMLGVYARVLCHIVM
ncbi:hypothetical protein PDE_09133 [Penicillium oxalicum 114-2]|uniref:Uncharacterized protein n=1 Tax=Penicillium oxalicum (strain 114-2 / CGMCC 5302) TaxID=933388 RepID=S7ZUQ2_PENO1|nr:hypothetical protein PDE_09133 [Penicillium oxalicum 114-2]